MVVSVYHTGVLMFAVSFPCHVVNLHVSKSALASYYAAEAAVGN